MGFKKNLLKNKKDILTTEVINEDSENIIFFWTYLKNRYPLADLFLPEYLPYNNILNENEVKLINSLIQEKDHYSIKEIIKLRYSFS